MGRVFNFSPGPSCLPLSVLERAGREISDYNGSGMSVMEMSHRTPIYEAIIGEAEALLRELMPVPANYKVLFMHGGATLQFAGVPMMLMNGSGKADYVISGMFSQKAFDEAKKYGDAVAIASSKDRNFSYIPSFTHSDIRPDADYVHICYNNTIFGTCFKGIPDTGSVPLVADMSSCILSMPYDVTKFGLMYAGAQKNAGTSGTCIVIVRDDLINKARTYTPELMNYKTQAANDSMLNTPSCYSVYISMLVFRWLRDEIGGLANMEKINREKAAVLYDFLDNSTFYKPHAEKEFRSLMNVTFVMKDEDMSVKFAKEAAAAGLVNTKGHRSVGGIRINLYNAMPIEGAKAMVEFMKKFEMDNR